jgi:hypothetical protein
MSHCVSWCSVKVDEKNIALTLKRKLKLILNLILKFFDVIKSELFSSGVPYGHMVLLVVPVFCCLC